MRRQHRRTTTRETHPGLAPKDEPARRRRVPSAGQIRRALSALSRRERAWLVVLASALTLPTLALLCWAAYLLATDAI